MKEYWVCTDYKRGQEHQILTLFRKVFGRDMSLSFWKWRFIENPFGEGIIKLLFDADKLIGYYAAIPMNLQVHSESVNAVFSMTTMTDPDYGGQGIFTYLAEETYKFCQQKGFFLVYGFPNNNSYYGFTHKLDWQDLGKMTALWKKLQPKAEESSVSKDIKQIRYFDDSVNSLWEEVKQSYSVIVPRTKEFLNWRFVQNPGVNYAKYIIKDANSHILGYVVLKIYVDGNVTIGHIVDMMCVANEEVVKLLLEYSYNYFLRRGIHNISCWIPESSFYGNILQEQGFVRKETETYFGVRIFNKDDALLRSAEGLSNWFLTMADSDVF